MSLGFRRARVSYSEGAEVDLAQESVGLDVVGVFRSLVLCGGDGFADAAEAEVKVGEAVLERGGGWVGVEGELVLFDGLGGVVRAARVDGQVFVHVRKAVVEVGSGAVGGCRGGRG